MAKPKPTPGTAALVCHGVYQYIRLPKEFRFEGEQVEIEKYGNGVVIRPLTEKSTVPSVKKAQR